MFVLFFFNFRNKGIQKRYAPAEEHHDDHHHDDHHDEGYWKKKLIWKPGLENF